MLFKRLCALSITLCTLTPLKVESKNYCVISWPRHNPGFFSIFNSIMGALAHYEDGHYTGVSVNFGNSGPYYDRSYGPNWWEYYFEPINVGSPEDAQIVGPDYGGFAGFAAYSLTRKEKYELIKKYFICKKHITDKIQQFIDENFKDYFVIGVHYRGTDKWVDAPRISYDTMYQEILKVAQTRNDQNWKIFVATDEAHFITYISQKFPGKVLSIDAIRSSNGAPVHYSYHSSNYKKGEDAILDCILLSKCNVLIRMASNLSLASTGYNPDIPVISLNKPNDGPQDVKGIRIKINHHAARNAHQQNKNRRD